MFFVDVQGTLLSDKDKSPINGSREFIDYLNTTNNPYMIVTNNTKNMSDQFFETLKAKGFALKNNAYIDPLMLLDNYVTTNEVAAYGDEKFLATLKAKGYNLNFTKPDYVIIGVKKDFVSDDFAQIIAFLLGGAQLIGMHESTLYATDGKRYPGTGAILQMLKAATQVQFAVVGKPSVSFYTKALEMLSAQVKHHINFEDITMISDDVKGDLVGAKELGMKTIFVLSGKYQNEEEILPYIYAHLRPDRILKDMQAVLEYVKEISDDLK